MFNNYTDEAPYQSCSVILKETEQFGALLVGDFNSPTDSEVIQKHQIKTIITAALGLEHLDISSSINHIVYPLLDSKNQNISDFFNTCNNTIDENIKKGSVLIHCSAGISRSATLVIAYLMKKKKIGFKEAISFVRKKRRNVCPNLGFERQLKLYEKQTVLRKEKFQQKKHASLHNYDLPKKNRFSNQNSLSSKVKLSSSKTPDQSIKRNVLVSVYNNNNFISCHSSIQQKSSKIPKKSKMKILQEIAKSKITPQNSKIKLKIKGSYQLIKQKRKQLWSNKMNFLKNQ